MTATCPTCGGKGFDIPCPDCGCEAPHTATEQPRGEERWAIYKPSPGDLMVEMHCCGFSFDAGHEDDTQRGGYTCPNCEAAHLASKLREVEIEAAQWQGSFTGMVAVEKELKARIREVEKERDKWERRARQRDEAWGEAVDEVSRLTAELERKDEALRQLVAEIGCLKRGERHPEHLYRLVAALSPPPASEEGRAG